MLGGLLKTTGVVFVIIWKSFFAIWKWNPKVKFAVAINSLLSCLIGTWYLGCDRRRGSHRLRLRINHHEDSSLESVGSILHAPRVYGKPRLFNQVGQPFPSSPGRRSGY